MEPVSSVMITALAGFTVGIIMGGGVRGLLTPAPEPEFELILVLCTEPK